MQLDFSQVTNDQLLQLIEASMQEAIGRGGAMAYTATSTYDEQKERLEATVKAAAKKAAADDERKRQQLKRETELEGEQAKQQRIWAKKKAIFDALLLHSAFEDEAKDPDIDFSVNIWSRSTDVRVYIQESGRRSRWEITYYHTGNQYHSPGSIEGVGDESEDQIVAFCSALCDRWNPGLRVSRSDVKQVKPEGEHYDKALTAYKKALEV